jgi:hypothetical protein
LLFQLQNVYCNNNIVGNSDNCTNREICYSVWIGSWTESISNHSDSKLSTVVTTAYWSIYIPSIMRLEHVEDASRLLEKGTKNQNQNLILSIESIILELILRF